MFEGLLLPPGDPLRYVQILILVAAFALLACTVLDIVERIAGV